MRAAGGTSVPLMLDWLMWLSIPNVNAEWEKPAARGRRRVVRLGRKGARNGHWGLQAAPLVVKHASPAAGRPASDLGEAGRDRGRCRPSRTYVCTGWENSFQGRAVSALLRAKWDGVGPG